MLELYYKFNFATEPPEEFKLKDENDQELAAEAQAFKEHLTKKKRNYK
ncbi:hypothetical protein [Staphylococcus agnetis]|nr:hypothetical protein [Staphylococcus agnetis]